MVARAIVRIQGIDAGWGIRGIGSILVRSVAPRRRGKDVVMALPRWLAKLNKRLINPGEIRRGVRPVLTHVGRVSGRTYRTPLDAHRLPDGFVFIPMYGPRTDWVTNILAAGTARLSIDGEELLLENPRMVSKKDVWPLLSTPVRTPPGISDESRLLRMDLHRETGRDLRE
jgi:deazaflavin-dependent oxidoreductase (nitroreductase family)